MPTVNGSEVTKVIVACDAGMGSSVMVASNLRSKLRAKGIDVVHTPVNEIPEGAKLVLCHQGLAARAQSTAPNAVVVPFSIFIGDPAFTRVEDAILQGKTLES
ncbi:PTS lactose transporter subunit IIB [Demequina flava]|uniref:PTS lactose transporter subunit IIB n=1 Tax=Demequina flava TaxID=1095025 RepID=UPI00078422B4|nr:PTS lactose transporter subunit IIB [Demequina flava]